jgi:hypothetical protein
LTIARIVLASLDVATRSTGREVRSDDTQEHRANYWARWAAGAVLAIGALLILAPAVWHLGAVAEDPFTSPRTTVRVVKTAPGGDKTVTETTSDANRSFLERSLAAGGLLLLRIGIVALSAFLAGAVVQRTLLGDFALKLGPLELPDVKRAAAASEQALKAIEERLEKQTKATESAMAVAADAAEGVARVEGALLPLVEMLSPEGARSRDAEQGAVDIHFDPDTERDA